ncbi:MAG TPA: hypothetical protein VN812_01465 [Candidatus Acidoferrales bacterium]|nr:hypothetical protein [Candidatus Acidoferrales bacterium]
MVSDRDREHFNRIATAEAQLNREAVVGCAARSPGANVALGLELSDFALAFGGDLTRPDEVAPIQRWRQRAALRK